MICTPVMHHTRTPGTPGVPAVVSVAVARLLARAMTAQASRAISPAANITRRSSTSAMPRRCSAKSQLVSAP